MDDLFARQYQIIDTLLNSSDSFYDSVDEDTQSLLDEIRQFQQECSVYFNSTNLLKTIITAYSTPNCPFNMISTLEPFENISQLDEALMPIMQSRFERAKKVGLFHSDAKILFVSEKHDLQAYIEDICNQPSDVGLDRQIKEYTE